MEMRAILAAELNIRQSRNPRYSLRAFARMLGMHHSTVSQLLQSRRRLTSRTIRRLGARLRLAPEQVREACVTEHCAAIRRLVVDPRFRADSRWISVMAGIPLDDVNVALHWLLYTGDLTMSAPRTWKLPESTRAQSSHSMADRLTPA